jgi:glutamate synthase domain-containing protein 3
MIQEILYSVVGTGVFGYSVFQFGKLCERKRLELSLSNLQDIKKNERTEKINELIKKHNDLLELFKGEKKD